MWTAALGLMVSLVPKLGKMAKHDFMLILTTPFDSRYQEVKDKAKKKSHFTLVLLSIEEKSRVTNSKFSGTAKCILLNNWTMKILLHSWNIKKHFMSATAKPKLNCRVQSNIIYLFLLSQTMMYLRFVKLIMKIWRKPAVKARSPPHANKFTNLL